MMKRSQSSNARPGRTRLSRSVSSTAASFPRSSKLLACRTTLSIIAGATLLLLSVFFLQARLGGFGSHRKEDLQTGLEDEHSSTYELSDEFDKLKAFDNLEKTTLADADPDPGTRIDLSELEQEEEVDESGNVEGSLEKLDELEVDDDLNQNSDVEGDEEGEQGGDEFDRVDEDDDTKGGEQVEVGNGNKSGKGKSLERSEQIKTVPRSVRVEEADGNGNGNGNGTLKAEKFSWDRVLGIMKMPADSKTGASLSAARKFELGKSYERDSEVFSSDDDLVGGSGAAADVEDALFLRKDKQLNAKVFGTTSSQKPVPLTNVFDTKYARKVVKPPFDPSNPTGNSLLQDPDTVEPWGLTKSDKAISRVFRKGDEVEDALVKMAAKGRKELLSEKARKRVKGDTRKWGAFPGIDPMLLFSEFMQEFLEVEKCELRVFMAWNSPPWSYTVRHQRGLESLLHFHPRACVVVFSETVELSFFKKFWSKGYRVAVVRPNLEEFLDDTPAEMFASVWLQWRKVDLFFVHYSELLRLAALYKYGGIYLDADVIVLRPLNSLRNVVGLEVVEDGKTRLNGAVMAFNKRSPYIKACLEEYTATYDDKLLDWNGADLLTRVSRTFKSEDELHVVAPTWFFPLSSSNIISYFQEGGKNASDLEESYTLHLWNRQSGSLVPERKSVVGVALEQHCIWCGDIL